MRAFLYFLIVRAPMCTAAQAHEPEERSLTLWKSPDGIHWTQMQEEGVFRNEGYFDSQNVAFWDPNIQAYRAYFREICDDSAHLGGIRRDIKTGTPSVADFFRLRGREGSATPAV